MPQAVHVDDHIVMLTGRQLGPRREIIARIDIGDLGVQIVHGALEHLRRHPFRIRRQRTELVVIDRRRGNIGGCRSNGENARPRRRVQAHTLRTLEDQLPFISLGNRNERIRVMLRGKERDRHEQRRQQFAVARIPMFGHRVQGSQAMR